MKKIKCTSHHAVFFLLAVTLSIVTSCKKNSPDQPAISPWQEKSSSAAGPLQYIIEMSEPDQTSCYGIIYDNSGAALQDLSITHDGGMTWQRQTVTGMENNFLIGLAANEANTVHVFGYDYTKGGSNVFRSMDGGSSWQREAANAYSDPTSYADQMHFFNSKDGVIIGDPHDNYFEIYTTNSNGNSWKRIPVKNIPPPLPNEYPLPFESDSYENTVWSIFGTLDSSFIPISARLMQSDDKGETWYVKNPSMALTGGDGSLKFRNHSVGLFKNNGKLYRTMDGGATWNVVNYSGHWYSFDLDNVPGKPGWWISTGGGTIVNPNSQFGYGSSISYDDGDHWVTLDTDVNHTCVDMTSPTHGYSGGVATGTGKDGVFVYKFSPPHQP